MGRVTARGRKPGICHSFMASLVKEVCQSLALNGPNPNRGKHVPIGLLENDSATLTPNPI